MVSADVLRTNVAPEQHALFVTIGVLSASRHAEPNRPLAHPPAACLADALPPPQQWPPCARPTTTTC